MFQPCDLFELGLFIIERISSSFIFNDESRLSVLMVRGGKILVFDNGIHGDAKNIIKDVGFLWEVWNHFSITNPEGIEVIFLILKKRFNILQYVLGTFSWWLGVYSIYWLFHDGDRYHIETSPLICSANQWTGFYMITASVMKELINIFV